MARFQGNIHKGSDRVAATVLFVVLLVAILLVAWYVGDRAGFDTFWNGLLGSLPGR